MRHLILLAILISSTAFAGHNKFHGDPKEEMGYEDALEYTGKAICKKICKRLEKRLEVNLVRMGVNPEYASNTIIAGKAIVDRKIRIGNRLFSTEYDWDEGKVTLRWAFSW